MNRYLFTIISILATLVIAWPVFGQNEAGEGKKSQQGREDKSGIQNRSAEEKAKLRERLQNLSEEEKEKLKAQMRERAVERAGVFGRQEQLKIIEDIESRLAKLRTSIKEAPDREEFRKSQEASPEQQAKLRKEWQRVRQEQQQAINAIQEQLVKLAGSRPPVAARPDIPVTELKAVHELAIEEKATKTAERIEKLIAKYQRGTETPVDESAKPERPRQQQKQSDSEEQSPASGEKAGEKTK